MNYTKFRTLRLKFIRYERVGMYKRACIFLLLTAALFNSMRPMDLVLKPVSIGCQPLEVLNVFLQEYKPYIYTSVAFLVGGFFVYDFITKHQRIKQLEQDVLEVKNHRGGTSVLSHIALVEQKLEKYINDLEKVDDDTTYLWEYVITIDAIQRFNKIENEGNPYIYRPRIPQFKNKNVIDLMKEIFGTVSQENRNGFFALKNLSSPRRKSPDFLSSSEDSSPRANSSDEDDLKRRKKYKGKEKKSPLKGENDAKLH